MQASSAFSWTLLMHGSYLTYLSNNILAAPCGTTGKYQTCHLFPSCFCDALECLGWPCGRYDMAPAGDVCSSGATGGCQAGCPRHWRLTCAQLDWTFCIWKFQCWAEQEGPISSSANIIFETGSACWASSCLGQTALALLFLSKHKDLSLCAWSLLN